MKTEYLPFTEEMIPAAGVLLAKRHACNRKSLPLLPARFEDPQMAVKAIEARRKQKHKNGYVAFQDGKMVAYLFGETTNDP